MADWAENFKCWEADAKPVMADRFCGACGANQPIEAHETWCPNDRDRSIKDDTAFWYRLGLPAHTTAFYYDTSADAEQFDTDSDDDDCDCNECEAVADLTEADIAAWLEEDGPGDPPDDPYHAPERPAGEDWGLRDKCLTGVGTGAGIGLGGAPTRATTLPTTPAERKSYPVASGVLDYFPDALAAIAHISWNGNEQHNPGQPLHWARSKSADEADTMIRHFLQRGSLDVDGMSHTAKMAWRALALLQKEIEGHK